MGSNIHENQQGHAEWRVQPRHRNNPIPLTRWTWMLKQIPRSSRRNELPMKLIDRVFLMRHEYLTGALVELLEIGQAASSADGVLHHAPEAFNGIEVVPTMGG